MQEQVQALALASTAGTMAARTPRLGTTAGTQAQVTEADSKSLATLLLQAGPGRQVLWSPAWPGACSAAACCVAHMPPCALTNHAACLCSVGRQTAHDGLSNLLAGVLGCSKPQALICSAGGEHGRQHHSPGGYESQSGYDGRHSGSGTGTEVPCCSLSAPASPCPLTSAKVAHGVSTTASGAPYRCHAAHPQLTMQSGHLGSTENLYLALQVGQQASSTTKADRQARAQVGRPSVCEALHCSRASCLCGCCTPVGELAGCLEQQPAGPSSASRETLGQAAGLGSVGGQVCRHPVLHGQRPS